ncbi:MAG: ABC transporter permease [Gammaproteobacteria bacterium]|nr:ABC transporter permease [Gammaproteobacteria bacterium]
MMSYLKAVFLLAANDLKLALKDRSTILWLFIMPAVFFYFIGTVTQGGVGFTDASASLVVENHDGGFLSKHLETRLEENLFTIVRRQDIPPVEENEEPKKYRTLTIPADFTAKLTSQEQVSIAYKGLRRGFGNDYDFFRVQKAAYSVLGDLIVVKSSGEDITPAKLAQAVDEIRPVQLEVTPAGRQMQIPSGFEQAIPGTLVMFTLLVLLTSGAAMLVDDREKQLLRRLASAPLTRGQVVMGKWAGRMALATVQIAVAIGVSFTPLFDMDWGHSLPMVVVILLAWGALCTSLALLLGSLARTDSQAANLGVFATMTLAALGGCWWPIEVAPDWMQQLQMFIPTGWTMDALHKLISFGMPWQSTLPHMAILITTSILVGWAASRRFRFT